MTWTNVGLPVGQSVYQIMGFDRVNFVGEVTNAVPQDEHCRIMGLSFESDGLRAQGQLTVLGADERQIEQIVRRLRAIQGLVSVKQTN
jgi:hypothetical protein